MWASTVPSWSKPPTRPLGSACPGSHKNSTTTPPNWGPDPVQPGDLVFFGSGPDDVTYVGIYIGDGQMVDAPDTGAQVESTPTTLGASWGSNVVVGVNDPAA